MSRNIIETEFHYYRKVTDSLEKKANLNRGWLSIYEHWRLHYCRKPFLYFETDEEVTQRAYDAFNNLHFLGEEGKIEPRSPENKHWFGIWETFQESIEEMKRRGMHPRDIIGNRENIDRYFINGDPIGIKLLNGLNFPLFNKLLKFSQQNHVQSMLKFGRFKISPASYYDTPAYNVAMADIEIERSYRVSLISEYMDGKEFIGLRGKRIPVSQGYLPVRFPLPDYYLFSTCGAPERRMPTDFQSDSALLIHCPKEFTNRMKAAMHKSYPTWQCMDGPVKYYDRYKDYPADRDQEFYKDFKFAYQTEHRIVLRPNRIQNNSNPQPFFVELGDLSDIAEILN